MTDRSIEEPDEDAVERRGLADFGGPGGQERERPLDVDEADAAEQQRALADDQAARPRERPLDVDEADAAEQQRAVELDEDEYR